MLPNPIVRNVSPSTPPAALPIPSLPLCPNCEGRGHEHTAIVCPDCLGDGVDPAAWTAHQEWKTDFIRRYGRSS